MVAVELRKKFLKIYKKKHARKRGGGEGPGRGETCPSHKSLP